MTVFRVSLFVPFVACLASACYAPVFEPGQQACAAGDRCPEGQFCAPDKHCYPTGFTPTCKDTCTGATAICDKVTLQCVQCLADPDCPAGYLCAAHVCKPGCSGGHAGCPADAGQCDVDLGVCRGCLVDSECPAQTPRCEPMSGVCLPCLQRNDNCPDGQYCDILANGGRACKPGCKDDAACVKRADGGAGNPMCCMHQCADLDSDDAHCGGCAKACANGQHCCKASCADYQTDMNNCGGCGKVCQQKNVAGPRCSAGACDYASCSAGFDDCDKVRGNGCEVDLQNDNKNCGSCGNVCPAPANASAACVAGKCTITGCDPGFGDCDGNFGNGCEVNLNTDIGNCGKCKNACPAIANGAATCNGTCGLRCNVGFADCDTVLNNGCEINTVTDPANCGGCRRACMVPNGVPGCAASMCTVASCNGTFRNCDNMVANGCEVNVATDADNCSACGAACSPANMATRTCAAGACNGTCNAGFADCDNNKQANGCEINLNTDPNNCSGCARACSNNNMASRTCAGGACNGNCAAGFADCDNNKASNGCEIATATDPNNCGACGTVCSAANMATRTCAAGACNGACAAGFADCDANKQSNGCEINVSNDMRNCGSCAIFCGNQQTCAGGVCGGSYMIDTALTPTGTSPRAGGGDACGANINVTNNVIVRQICANFNAMAGGNVKFVIFSHPNHVVLYTSAPVGIAAGAGYRCSPAMAFQLNAGSQYDISPITDMAATYNYDSVADNAGPVQSVVSNCNVSNYATPAVAGHGGADCSIRLY